MKLAPIVLAVIAWLGAGSLASCSHGECAPTGPGSTPQCLGWNQPACATISGCRWGTGCTVKVQCGGRAQDQATCATLGYCEWTEGNACEERANPCAVLAADQCTSDVRCMQASGCIGTPAVACESRDDEDSCESDMNCDWYPTPAF